MSLTLFARPNGVTELIAVYLFLTIYFYLNEKKNLYLLIPLGLLVIIYINYLGKNAIKMLPVYETWFMLDLKQFGFDNLNVSTYNLKICLNLTEQEILNLNRTNSPKSSLSFWICSFIYSPIEVIKIAFLRVFVVLSGYKPSYSMAHNLFVLFTLTPIYVLFIFGLIKDFNLKKFYILCSILLILISISIYYVDGDNRVFTAFLPLILIISSGGLNFFLKFIFKKTND